MTAKKRKTGKTKSTRTNNASSVTRDELLTYFRDMLLIRRFEEKAGQLYGMGLIGGFCHLYIGQEAVITGIQKTLEPGDSVITGYRCHAHMLAGGGNPKAIMAELAGREGGVSGGMGGSMHMYIEGAFYGGNGIVGAQVPLGTGLGFANKYKDNKKVSVTYFGDGAANQGQVFEAFNMAALWELPVVYVIENNQYAMGTSIARSTAIEELHRRGVAFGIPGEQVDGMDVVAVQAAAAKAVDHCRKGKGPILLEMMTYRYRGHSMSDPAKYRSKEEVSKVRHERDPIEHVRELLISGGHADEDALKAIDREIRAEVNEATEFAQSSPEPGTDQLTNNVLADA